MAIYDDWSLDFTNKIISHDTGTTVYSVRSLYTWIQDELDDSGNVDDTIPMTAQTKQDFTLTNGWFLSELPTNVATNYLNGGGITTDGWDGEIYVLTMSGTPTNPISTDIGKTVHNTGSTHTGTLLGYTTTAPYTWWIRVGTGVFSAEAVTITSGTGAGTISTAATGEAIWANIYTIGTIEDNTDIYLVQNFAKITSWWAAGHIDVLVKVQSASTLIDFGILTVYARQYTKLYDYFQSDVSTGGRNPIPLSTSSDINNTDGDYQMVLTTAASGPFVVGEVIVDGSDSTLAGVITSVSGSNPNVTLQYYLISSLANFSSGTGSFSGQTSGGTATAVNPTAVNAGAVSGITFTFGHNTDQDIGDGDGPQPYDVMIDCNGYHLTDFYEYSKYVTNRGSTTTLAGRNGEQYFVTGTARLAYTSQTAAFLEGAVLTGGTSDATGIIEADHDSGTTGFLVVKDVRGTFVAGEIITDDQGTPGSATIAANGVTSTLVIKTAPLGTFAGGKFFGARGVWIENMHADDANNYQLIDANNVSRIPPASISIAVNGVISGDRVSVFKATGASGVVEKAMYSISEALTQPLGYIRISGSAPLDTPATGVIHVVRKTAGGSVLGDESYNYTAWTDNVTYTEFTLSGTTTEDYGTTDSAYVPYIEQEATGTSVSVSVQYVAVRDVVVNVRKKGILPFTLAGVQITSSGLSATAIRTADTIVD